jgi:hypothetical protein
MIRRTLLPADQRARFEVPVMQGNRAHAIKAALQKRTTCRVDHDFVKLPFLECVRTLNHV